MLRPNQCWYRVRSEHARVNVHCVDAVIKGVQGVCIITIPWKERGCRGMTKGGNLAAVVCDDEAIHGLLEPVDEYLLVLVKDADVEHQEGGAAIRWGNTVIGNCEDRGRTSSWPVSKCCRRTGGQRSAGGEDS